MKRLILGTAGHIDHGKTALVRALTGTDTDRLAEEKARGITIELGFAEMELPEVHFGVVDVPGHEAFVRAMVAGAAGMDLVLLVVAADEGVMPQTREHLAIVRLLGVGRLVVALTKADTVDAEWLELVGADVEDLLAGTPYEGAPRVATSSVTGSGLDDLRAALAEAAGAVGKEADGDLLRLPLDRVFTIQGTGTVVTGTVWTGTLSKGDQLRVLPAGLAARVRGVQVHGREVDQAVSGDRAAVALTGDGADREIVERGETLIGSPAWDATWMLTARVSLLADTAWSLEHNQRVRVHVGTAEVMARTVLLEPAPLTAGANGWVQLRLEAPVLARTRDPIVLRAYSPVTTIGGGRVAEPNPRKRSRLGTEERAALAQAVDGDAAGAVAAVLALAGWDGVPVAALPVRSGLPPGVVEGAAAALPGALGAGGRLFAPAVAAEAARLLTEHVDEAHRADPIRASIPLAGVRDALPGWAPPELADAVIDRLAGDGVLERAEGGVRRVGHSAALTDDQAAAADAIVGALKAAGLASPELSELPGGLSDRSDFWSLMRHLEGGGRITQVADGYYVPTVDLDAAIGRIREEFGGRTGLGPSDFREVLGVTRKHLIPLLNHLDGRGVTLRGTEGREVPD